MSNDADYKPIRLTKGKSVDYNAILKKPVPVNKDVVLKQTAPSAELAKLGIKGETTLTYRRDDKGNLVLDKAGKPVTDVSFRPTEVPAWFTKAVMVLAGKEPCYFEGCEEVVEEYKKELAALESNPKGCSECAKASLKRKYSRKFQQALPPVEANKLAQPTVPPYRVINHETKTITVSPRKPGAYTTIRREIPKGVLESFTKKAGTAKLIVNGQEIEYHGTPEHAQFTLPQPSGESGNTSNS